MSDDIPTRLRRHDWSPTALNTADEIERLRAAIDALLAEIDTDHQPDPVPGDGAGREPLLCRTCGASDGSWPCVHRMALDELKEVRRG